MCVHQARQQSAAAIEPKLCQRLAGNLKVGAPLLVIRMVMIMVVTVMVVTIMAMAAVVVTVATAEQHVPLILNPRHVLRHQLSGTSQA